MGPRLILKNSYFNFAFITIHSIYPVFKEFHAIPPFRGEVLRMHLRDGFIRHLPGAEIMDIDKKLLLALGLAHCSHSKKQHH
ncbi:MAG TPA: hypothetical protein VNS58_00375 [Puia sp.]|nr:hypothetical protein [Puia sp.]